VESVTLSDGESVPVDGIFCLRNAIAPSSLIPGIQMENGHIVVNRDMETNLPGCFAAGDCTGRPYQYTKAVGEGNVAAHSIIAFLHELEQKD
jgi:thioredoxin reductase (NADPH)